MLRGAASRVGPLALRLREGGGPHYFQEDLTRYGGLVNDSSPVKVILYYIIYVSSPPKTTYLCV